MKSFTNNSVSTILLCAIFCFGWSTEKTVITVPKHLIESLRQQAVVCSKETGAPPETLKMIIDWTVPDELPSKKFLLCISSNTGFLDETGHFNVDKLGALKPENGTQEEYVEAIKDCNKITKEDPYSTLFANSECIVKKYTFKLDN